MATFSLQDVSYGLGISQTEELKLDDVLNIVTTRDGRANNYKNGSTVIINSDRLILNSKKDYVMLCGKEGVTITSPKGVHIDCDGDLHLFSSGEVYIGLPNKGQDYNFDKQRKPKTKAQATVNSKFEPMVLGLKLANLLQDLMVLLKNTTIITPAGQGFMSAEMMYNFASLQARIPEMLSTYAFLDGVSHEGVDPEPPLPAGVRPTTGNVVEPGAAGSTLTAQTAATTVNQNSTDGTPQANIQEQAASSPGATLSPGAILPIAADPSTSEPTAPSTNPDGGLI